MQAISTRVADLEPLKQVLRDAAEEALNLGFPQTAQLLGRLAAGEALVQVVVRGGVVQAVHGLPTEIDAETYDVLDYDDLAGGLDKGEIDHVYRLSGVPLPSDPLKACEGLVSAFARLEWIV